MNDVAPLFTPFSLRNLTVANRFAMAPMTRSRSPDGIPGRPVLDYYRRRAEGGVGLIVTEGIGVDHPASLGVSDFDGAAIPVLHGDAALSGWRAVVSAVHEAGGRIVPQLWHQGAMRPEGTGRHPGHPSSRPSGIWGPANARSTVPPAARDILLPKTRALSDSEIADIISGFAGSALNAKAVGFDGIALHGAHGYLLDSFLWSTTNVRHDKYGGDIARRARFAAEVVAAVREAIGPDLPIIFRFSQWKQQDLDAVIAHTPNELGEVLGPLADAGVDLFDASTRRFDEPAFEGSDLNLAGWARKLTGRPTMTVGGVGLDKDLYASIAAGQSEPAGLERVLARFDAGEFDMIALGRALIADPNWVQKVARNEPRHTFTPMMLAELN